MSSMDTSRQGGYVSSLLIPLIVSVLLLIGFAVFGAWAFTSRQDYKNNSDKKAAAAAQAAKTATEATDAAKYAEEAKSPLKTYNGPAAFGGITMQYPKTWSGYVVEKPTNTSKPLDNYFQPGVVPDITNQDSVYALRIEVVGQPYDRVMQQFASQTKTGKVSAAAYSLPKVPSVVGSRLTGEIENKRQGSMVVLPLRNLTLQVWTESDQYLGDFNNIILPNLSFSP